MINVKLIRRLVYRHLVEFVSDGKAVEMVINSLHLWVCIYDLQDVFKYQILLL